MKNLNWFILVVLSVSVTVNFFLTGIFMTFSYEDYLLYPILEITIALFILNVTKNFLLSIYFWYKKYWLLLFFNLITNAVYLYTIWLFYLTLIDAEVSRREIMYTEKTVYWLWIVTGLVYFFSRSKESNWLRIYGVCIVLFEITEDLLSRTQYDVVYEVQAYLACASVLLLLFHFASELKKFKSANAEILDRSE